uniref:Exosome complex component CSL4 n=1 Tax=Talaromyces marneffei PM1 TaxID=1077442 RepID=A0A093VXB4_TALMA
MENPLPTLAVPGQQLATTSTYLPGAGTHVQNGIICASIPGPVFVEQLPGQTKSKASKSILSVLRSGVGNIGPNGVIQKAPAATTTTTVAGTKKPKYNTLPAVDSVVLARVTRVQKRQVTLSILVVLDDASTSDNDNIAAILTSAANPENQSTSDELRFQALIRKEDVRAVEKDRVVLEEMFRVGDVVRGSIISLGDQSFYYLTTARNDLGVVMARSDAGNMMFPVSWKEMKDPVTGASESRKVARPF